MNDNNRPISPAYPVNSMTAFGREDGETELGSFYWELRSVNHRYLDINVKLPERFRSLEPVIRDKLRSQLTRGKCEVQLNMRLQESQRGLSVDRQLLEQVLATAAEVQALAPTASPMSTQQLLNWPGVLQAETIDVEHVQAQLLASLDSACAQLLEARASEGVRMAAVVDERLDSILAMVEQLEKALPEIVADHQQRLQEKLAGFQVELEPERLAQEVALLAQRADVAEELDRLRAHVDAVREAMASGKPCGRRLDFLMQELNREANTLGSKSISIENSNGAINLKVLIEQMREQVQNIE